MSDPNPNLGPPSPNLGPPSPLGGGSLDDDEKALKKGNTAVLVIGAVAALAVLAGVVVLLMGEEPTGQYETIGREVNRMKSANFDGFWACALPNERLDRVRNNRELTDAITKRVSGAPQRYAQHVRQQCLVKLNEHEAPLRSLIAPPDLQEQLGQLSTALGDLRAAWGEYLDYLDRTEEYDEAAAAPRVSKITKGWHDYKTAHGAINSAIRERLGQ
ncbi:MAG: hypothetical protein M5U28_20350 [Sandaracinaceae bacterium]|nr:hypothetical protein [Sandaracinaceae bacterium]